MKVFTKNHNNLIDGQPWLQELYNGEVTKGNPTNIEGAKRPWLIYTPTYSLTTAAGWLYRTTDGGSSRTYPTNEKLWVNIPEDYDLHKYTHTSGEAWMEIRLSYFDYWTGWDNWAPSLMYNGWFVYYFQIETNDDPIEITIRRTDGYSHTNTKVDEVKFIADNNFTTTTESSTGCQISGSIGVTRIDNTDIYQVVVETQYFDWYWEDKMYISWDDDTQAHGRPFYIDSWCGFIPWHEGSMKTAMTIFDMTASLNYEEVHKRIKATELFIERGKVSPEVGAISIECQCNSTSGDYHNPDGHNVLGDFIKIKDDTFVLTYGNDSLSATHGWHGNLGHSDVLWVLWDKEAGKVGFGTLQTPTQWIDGYAGDLFTDDLWFFKDNPYGQKLRNIKMYNGFGLDGTHQDILTYVNNYENNYDTFVEPNIPVENSTGVTRS